jgi:hypothetical protein
VSERERGRGGKEGEGGRESSETSDLILINKHLDGLAEASTESERFEKMAIFIFLNIFY